LALSVLLVVAPEKPFVPALKEASFVLPALEEVVDLKAVAVAAQSENLTC